MITRIFLDLDGVMVDIDSALKTIFDSDYSYGKIGSNVFWREIGKIPNFFLYLDPMPEYKKLFYSLCATGIPISILTSIPLPTNDNLANARENKVAWVRQYLDKDIPVYTVTGGEKKAEYVQSKNDLLIDDLAKNVAAWENAGGTGILFKNTTDTIIQLNKLLEI